LDFVRLLLLRFALDLPLASDFCASGEDCTEGVTFCEGIDCANKGVEMPANANVINTVMVFFMIFLS